MRRVLICAGLLVCLVSQLEAQGTPRAEVFGGFSYLRADGQFNGFNLNGWDASLTGNFNRWVGLEANLGGHYGTHPIPSHSSGFSSFFGPRFVLRTPFATPFVHAMFGAVYGTAYFPPILAGILCPITGCPARPPTSQFAPAVAVGGGIDLRAGPFISIRVIQADYIRTQFTNDTQNNARVSAGVVFNLGRIH